MGRKRAACDLYRFLVDPITQPQMKSKDAMKLATVASGGASRAEIFRWLKLDLSIAAVSQKEERRGAPALLSDDQEALLVGFALATRSILEPVTLTTLQQFCKSHLSVTPSLPHFVEDYDLPRFLFTEDDDEVIKVGHRICGR